MSYPSYCSFGTDCCWCSNSAYLCLCTPPEHAVGSSSTRIAWSTYCSWTTAWCFIEVGYAFLQCEWCSIYSGQGYDKIGLWTVVHLLEASLSNSRWDLARGNSCYDCLASTSSYAIANQNSCWICFPWGASATSGHHRLDGLGRVETILHSGLCNTYDVLCITGTLHVWLYEWGFEQAIWCTWNTTAKWKCHWTVFGSNLPRSGGRCRQHGDKCSLGCEICGMQCAWAHRYPHRRRFVFQSYSNSSSWPTMSRTCPAMQEKKHTEQTKKWFKYCIEWIGKFCHFLYWHRIPGDSPSVRCSTDWCSSVVKSKWLPMLDKRTIFPQFPINFHFPALSLYYIILLCIMIFPLVVV